MVISIVTWGCGENEESSESSWGMHRIPQPDSLLPTPHEVEMEFLSIVESADPDRPGKSAVELHEFLRANAGYEIADTVRVEIDRFRAAAADRYHDARELARRGKFDRSRDILTDLAEYFPDTPEGQSAREYLKFDFDMGRAKWLMVRQRFVECEAVARDLLDRDLTAHQMAQVEDILDSVGYVAAAQKQAERSSAESACQQLRVLLANEYVEMGGYPSRLSLEDIEEMDPFASRDIQRGLSAIENYHATRDGYSLVAVSAHGNHRIAIVNGEIQ
jgi:hypothetical protein